MVKDYVASCATCAHVKSPRHKPYGKLKQLPIPSRPWSSISMDFIKQLPDSEGFSAILVIVDCLTKQAIFIPSHDMVNTPQVVWLFLIHIFSKHRVPAHITSDRGSEFISHFFCSLGKLLQMRLHFTSGYHLEGDGQTACQSGPGTVFMDLYKLPAGRLGNITPNGQICLQQCHECDDRSVPILREQRVSPRVHSGPAG